MNQFDLNTAEGRTAFIKHSIEMAEAGGEAVDPLYRCLAENYFIPGLISIKDMEEVGLDMAKRIGRFSGSKGTLRDDD